MGICNNVEITKFANFDECGEINQNCQDNYYVQHLMGLVRLNKNTVLMCSVVEDDGKFEYFIDCNRGLWNTLDSYDEYYDDMMKFLSLNKDALKKIQYH